MPKPIDPIDVFRAIRQYALAYKKLEAIQRGGFLPIGDQKTGVIAEFYAQIYAERVYARVETGHSSQSAWDLKVASSKTGKFDAVQVKAVSDFSQTRRVSPIHPGWDQLWLICLNAKLEPYSFKIIHKKQVDWADATMKNRVMPGGPDNKAGSAEFEGAEDQTEAMLSAVRRKFLSRTF